MDLILVALYIGTFTLGMYFAWKKYKPIIEWEIDVII